MLPVPDDLTPLWCPRQSSSCTFKVSFARQQCIALPIHDPYKSKNEALQIERQIQLICVFNYARNNNGDAYASFGSYVVRITGNGTRMPVVLARHGTSFASSSILYDVSFNAAYISTYRNVSFSGPKHVLRIRLSPSFNFVDERGISMQPSAWIMPQSEDVQFPGGMSFDYSFIEPFSSTLIFYALTHKGVYSTTQNLNLMYYIGEGSSDTGSGFVRTDQPILLESPEDSYYAKKMLSVISTIYYEQAAPTMIMTLSAGLFVR